MTTQQAVCWDKKRACKMLNIPVRVVDMNKQIGGLSELNKRFILINTNDENKDRVWVHEIAHTLLHFQNTAAAAGRDQRLNAIAELEADTVAYIACKKIGCENREEYTNYVTAFMSRLPAESLTEQVLDERMPKLLNIVKIILKAGGYHE